ncbi:MAG: DUF559 domain-containing protein [Alphaproteobacteria bacterium]|nr:DUF559 domain-containing protein [Alphaproteobacteria bacterium]
MSGLVPLAKALRRRSTPMEAAVWRGLREKGLGGLKFRQQEPIGPYIVDFYCREARLAVEIDGATHAEPGKDGERDAYLTSREIKVLRFWNNEVMANREGVFAVILAEALARIYPPPGPLPQTREGEV